MRRGLAYELGGALAVLVGCGDGATPSGAGGSYAGCTTGGVCHGGPNPGAGMSMTGADSAYRVLIDVPSVSSLCAGTIRVIAGDPERSCLVRFYEGRLRDELGWVGQAEIDLVRSWIADGARP